MTASVRPAAAAPSIRSVRILALPMVILLAVEFLLGMALNLFVAVGNGSAVAVLSSNPVLVAHVVVALLLLGLSGRAVVGSFRYPVRSLRVGAALALVSSVAATLAGSSFTFGGQNGWASYGMSVAFLGVLMGAFLLLGPVARAEAATPLPGRSEEVRS